MILYVSILGMLGDFHAFNGHLLTFFIKNNFFEKNFLGTLSECPTVLV